MASSNLETKLSFEDEKRKKSLSTILLLISLSHTVSFYESHLLVDSLVRIPYTNCRYHCRTRIGQMIYLSLCI